MHVDDDVRLDISCGPLADTDAGYLTPVDDEGDREEGDGVAQLTATENSSSMRSKSSLNSLHSRSLVVQTLLRPSTRLAGIFDQAKRRNFGLGGSCVHEVLVDGCLAGVWNPGLQGVVRKAGSGGGTKVILGVDASWPAAAADDEDTFIFANELLFHGLLSTMTDVLTK